MAKKKTKSDQQPERRPKIGRPSKGPRKALNMMLPVRLREMIEEKAISDKHDLTVAVHLAIVEYLTARGIDVPPELRNPKTKFDRPPTN